MVKLRKLNNKNNKKQTKTKTEQKTPRNQWGKMIKQTNKQEAKQTNGRKKIPGLRTMEFQSLFKFWCYSSSIQSWCWYLI
jgi:hypothetical protein